MLLIILHQTCLLHHLCFLLFQFFHPLLHQLIQSILFNLLVVSDFHLFIAHVVNKLLESFWNLSQSYNNIVITCQEHRGCLQSGIKAMIFRVHQQEHTEIIFQDLKEYSWYFSDANPIPYNELIILLLIFLLSFLFFLFNQVYC